MMRVVELMSLGDAAAIALQSKEPAAAVEYAAPVTASTRESKEDDMPLSLMQLPCKETEGPSTRGSTRPPSSESTSELGRSKVSRMRESAASRGSFRVPWARASGLSIGTHEVAACVVNSALPWEKKMFHVSASAALVFAQCVVVVLMYDYVSFGSCAISNDCLSGMYCRRASRSNGLERVTKSGTVGFCAACESAWRGLCEFEVQNVTALPPLDASKCDAKFGEFDDWSWACDRENFEMMCRGCARDDGDFVSRLESVTYEHLRIGVGEFVALALCSIYVSALVCAELKQIRRARILLRLYDDDDDDDDDDELGAVFSSPEEEERRRRRPRRRRRWLFGFRHAVICTNALRRFLFLPGIVTAVCEMALIRGSDVLSMLLNLVALTFLLELDDVSSFVALAPTVQEHVEAMGLEYNESTEATKGQVVAVKAQNIHMLLVVGSILGRVICARLAASLRAHAYEGDDVRDAGDSNSLLSRASRGGYQLTCLFPLAWMLEQALYGDDLLLLTRKRKKTRQSRRCSRDRVFCGALHRMCYAFFAQSALSSLAFRTLDPAVFFLAISLLLVSAIAYCNSGTTLHRAVVIAVLVALLYFWLSVLEEPFLFVSDY